MIQSPSADPTVPSAATSTRLLETGMELVRAEVALVLARARQTIVRALAALLATILAAALLQVALVVGILSPLIARTLPPNGVWMAVGLPSVLALASLLTAGLAWGGVRRSLQKSETSAIPRSDTARAHDSGPRSVSLKEERLQQ